MYINIYAHTHVNGGNTRTTKKNIDSNLTHTHANAYYVASGCVTKLCGRASAQRNETMRHGGGGRGTHHVDEFLERYGSGASWFLCLLGTFVQLLTFVHRNVRLQCGRLERQQELLDGYFAESLRIELVEQVPPFLFFFTGM